MSEHVDAPAFESRVRALLRPGGVPRLWPRRAVDRWILLHCAARRIAPGERLSERDASARIQDWLLGPGRMLDVDYASLRRALVDEGFWDREPQGADYRRSQRHESRVTFASDLPAEGEVLAALATRRGPPGARIAAGAPARAGREPDPGAARFARLALEAIEREHPFHLLHLVRTPEDVAAPRALHPVFHGSFDWHSAVHGHWCVVRALREGDPEFAARAWPVLERRLTAERLEGERRYLAEPERAGFERPYGLAWLLQLGAELREWDEPHAAPWRAALAPLETVARDRLAEWLPRLPYPIRSGEHAQSAFAMGLALDWARTARDESFARLLEREAIRLHARDRDAPLHLEPSGHDFLSPILGEADLMRRVLGFGDFTSWLPAFLPELDDDRARRWLEPVASPDLADGKLSHLAGLNLSRAWMLEGIVAALDESAPIAAILARAAARHRDAGLAAVTDGPYAATHWLGSFAVYLVTRRGLPAKP